MARHYAVSLLEMPPLSLKHVHRGRCPQDHDLTLPGALSRSSHRYRCVPCWHAERGPALCKARLHPLVAGAHGCRECAAASRMGPKDMSYLFVGLPPAEVMQNAACSPENASWFDALENPGRAVAGGAAGKLPQETLAALAICEGCPVRNTCLIDALQWRREGVWGGAYFGRRWHQAYRSARRNGTPLPAFRTLSRIEARQNRARNLEQTTVDTPDMTA